MRVALAFALLAAVSAQSPQSPPRDAVSKPQSATGSMAGRVTDATSRLPVANATVTAIPIGPVMALSDPFSTTGRQAVSNGRGEYVLRELPPGAYSLVASPPQHEARYRAAVYGAASDTPMYLQQGTAVTVGAGEQRGEINFALPRTFAIEGRVLNAAGRPLSGVDVGVELSPSGVRVGHGPAGHETDDRGRFRVYGLAPGTYRVCVNPARLVMPGLARSAERSAYVSTCYPASASPGAAEPLTLRDSDLTGLDIQLQRGGTYTISGHIVPESGVADPKARVEATRIVSGGFEGTIYPEVKDGAFVVTDVVPGEYRLGASGGDGGESGGTTVHVDVADVTGVVIRTSRGATLKGRVAFEGASMRASAREQLSVAVGETMFATQPAASARPGLVMPDLSFEMTRVYGTGALRVDALPDGWVAKSVEVNGEDVTDRSIDFASLPKPAWVRIVLTDRVARLRVRVTGASSETPRSAVIVAPADPARRSAMRVFGKGTPEGDLDFGAMAPGPYVIALLPLGSFSPATTSETLSRILESGRRITLAAGENAVVELPLPSGR